MAHGSVVLILVYTLGFLLPKTFKINWVSNLLTMSIHDEGHWWRSFHTPVVCTKLDTYVFASKTLSNLHSFTWSFDSSCMTSERSYHSGCTRSEESMSYFWTLERIWHEKKSNIKFRSWISYDVGGWVWNKYQN